MDNLDIIAALRETIERMQEENDQLQKDNEQLMSALEKATPPVITPKIEEVEDVKIPWGEGEVGWGKY
jgi:regulator of replication initiation timing